MTGSRVLLTTLSVRTSAKGNAYLAGWLGKASVVAFPGEADKFGNPTWDLFLAQPEPRDGPRAPPEAAAEPPPARQRAASTCAPRQPARRLLGPAGERASPPGAGRR